ncbi:MAG: hypothetical protein AB9835_14585 [Eubacteriales bacterium]
MTYTYCKKIIANKTYSSAGDMLTMLDVFLLNNRITVEQYNELVTMLAA